MTLCHDITAMRDGFKGAAFRRGHVIEPGDVEKLLDLGKRTVYIWEENAGEIHEEDAARRMAAMAQVADCHYTAPSEGKVLLMADTRGMFRVDTALLHRINAIGDLTISTLPDHFPVEAGDRLASMRIVPLVTREEQICRAEALCAGQKLLELKPCLQLGMRLGEGSGCPLAFRVVEAACAVINTMATFPEAAIDDGYLTEIREKDSFTV